MLLDAVYERDTLLASELRFANEEKENVEGVERKRRFLPDGCRT